MMDTVKEIEVLVVVAVLGEQVDNFWRGDIGKYLLAHIQSEINDSIKELSMVDAENAKLVRTAQNKIWRAKALQGWIDQAITAGLKAKLVLEDRED